MRVSTVAAVVVLLSGCLPSHLWHRERHRDPAVDRKVVVSKEKPTSLIAADGSRCLVTHKKYTRTAVGDHTWCMWSAANGQRTAYSWGGINQDEPPGERRKPWPGSGGGTSHP